MVVGAGFDWGYELYCAEWAEAFQLTFPIIDDSANTLVNTLGIPTIPFNIIIDQNRVVQYASYGFNATLIANKIDSLLTALELLATSPVDTEPRSLQPAAVFLASPYPNPFNPVTTISYSLPEAAVARLEVVDLSGRTVATLMKGWQESGSHQIIWEARNLASGAYIIRLISDGASSSRIVILSK